MSLRLFLVAVAVFVSSVALAKVGERMDSRSRTLWSHLKAERFDRAVKMFDPTMTEALPEAKLAQVWQSIVAQAGPPGDCSDERSQKVGAAEVVLSRCRFGETALDMKVSFDAKGKVNGLFFLPPAPPWQPPPYADKLQLREQELQVTTSRWSLPATLTLPGARSGKVPAVVLVHGSGPNDRDESVGASKPFKDLAWGLASRGVAVLRYEKRTRVYGGDISDPKGVFTVEHETVDDAVSAVELLVKRAEIDPARVFVVGHSLGGTVIPRIAARAKGAAGFIVMAGSTRALEDAMVEQLEYIIGLGGPGADAARKQLDAIRPLAAKVKALSAKDAASTAPLLGAPPAYWLDLRAHDPLVEVRAIGRPILVMQGGRDYQVTVAEFERWKQSLAADKRATFKLYKPLNHLFIAGEGPSRPEEYGEAGHVDRAVIDDIAAFVLGGKR